MKLRILSTLLFAAVVIAITSGCAGLPTPEVMKAETANFVLPKLPEPNKAIVYVFRPSSLGALIRFNVFVDNQEANSEMGFTRGNQYIHFNIAPGQSKILSKAENWAELEVNAKPGDIIFIRQEVSMGLIMARNTIVESPDYEGKSQIKSRSIGTMIKQDK